MDYLMDPNGEEMQERIRAMQVLEEELGPVKAHDFNKTPKTVKEARKFAAWYKKHGKCLGCWQDHWCKSKPNCPTPQSVGA